jgi:endoglucanase
MKRVGPLLVLLAVAAVLTPTSSPGRTARPLSIKVAGRKLVNAAGKAIQLRGVNRSSFEYACAQGWGFHEGPVDAASITSMRDGGSTWCASR